MSETPARRLVVNPAPLEVVTERPGNLAPDRDHVLALKLDVRLDVTHLRRVSVHRETCPRIPATEGWVSRTATRDEVGRTLDEADRTGVPVSISCHTCGGWSALP